MNRTLTILFIFLFGMVFLTSCTGDKNSNKLNEAEKELIETMDSLSSDLDKTIETLDSKSKELEDEIDDILEDIE